MKLSDYDLTGSPQELIDAVDDIRTIINFGKYNPQVVTSVPTWIAPRGENVLFLDSTGGRLYYNVSDNTATWKIVAAFLF